MTIETGSNSGALTAQHLDIMIHLILVLSLLNYIDEESGSEKLSYLHKVTQLVNIRTWI